ncbi:glycosyltransferase family 1 protein [Massilia sp. Se16.2.3]|uniref:glycosyltransferase family 4 protein n=1 Tax=Massilia sp. Se16.2.3 TaxID=2709303 RepID=UPI001E456C99|nr:glycosyltransferase family 1 protein [Massilia sp. Se16.2.3]
MLRGRSGADLGGPQRRRRQLARHPDRAAVAATLARHRLQPGYFLFVGTLQPRKNVERVLGAYLALPAAVRAERALVIVGAAGWRCETLLRRIAAAQADGARVIWLDKLGEAAALRHVYAGAGVFVFPSLYEGFGIPVLEAFASNVPVVTSSTTSLPEVSAGAALEVDPLDEGAIGAAMLAPVRDDALRERCIRAGPRPRQRADLARHRPCHRRRVPQGTGALAPFSPTLTCASFTSTRPITRTPWAASSR